MSACSYFSAVEDPGLMSSFWAAYFVMALLLALNRISIIIMFPIREFIMCFKINGWGAASLEYATPLAPERLKAAHESGFKADMITPPMKIAMMRNHPMKGCTDERIFVSAPCVPPARHRPS